MRTPEQILAQEPLELPFPWKFERHRYSELYLLRQITESEVQKNIVQLLTNYSVDVCAIDAGGRKARGRIIGAAKAAGLAIGALANIKTGGAITKGYADLSATLAPSGRSLYIEVKAPEWLSTTGAILRAHGSASAEQLDFLLSKYKRGALVLVAWSPSDVQDSLGELLEENRRAIR